MAVFTRMDAAQKAKELTKPTEEKIVKKMNAALNHSVAYLSLIIVAMTVVLYSYNASLLREYHIPAECMVLDLRSYIPFAIILIRISMILLYYISFSITDKILKKKNANILRVLYAFIIIECILYETQLNKILGPVSLTLLSLLIPIGIELAHSKYQTTYNKEIDEEEYKMLVEEYMNNYIIRSMLIKCGLFLIIISGTVAPLIGSYVACSKTEYQIYEKCKTKYAVIIDYDNSILVQKAIEKKNNLIIDTSCYYYFAKDDSKLSYKQFDSVIIE